MWVLDLLDDADVLELDVEVLVHALEGAADLDVVLELDCDLVVDQGLEETVRGVWVSEISLPSTRDVLGGMDEAEVGMMW